MADPKYNNWKYKNTTLLILSFFILFFLADKPFVKSFIGHVSSLDYFGIFFTGIFFVSIFTVVPATIILFSLAENFHPAIVAVFAGIGGLVGDYIIFRFLKDKIFFELEPVFSKLIGKNFKKIFHSPYFSWLLPIFGAMIIASPLPDELGVSMMGLSKVKNWQFALICLVLNTLGIFVLVSIFQAVNMK